MGLLKLFSRSSAGDLLRLPKGSFSVDRRGEILISTLPRTFPQALALEIGRRVLAAFRGAQAAQLPLSEVVIHYPSLTITAREMRGGALVFLSPQSSSGTSTPASLPAYA